MSNPYIVPPHLPDIVALGIQLWGEPTKRTPKEVRFGKLQSKSVCPAPENIWFDNETNQNGGYRDLYKLANGAYPENGTKQASSAIVATYDYRDENGTLLFQVCRKVPKTFIQRQPDATAKSGWKWSTKGVRRVPYHLPELLAASPDETVFIVEGEKDVDNLRKLGLIATCNAGGASKWTASLNEHLTGRRVVILPDNDDAGAAHGRDMARKLFGIAASIAIIPLPGLPDKGDVSNWISAGGTAADLTDLVAAAPVLTERPANDAADAPETKPKKAEKPELTGWQMGLMTDDRGVIANLANAAYALREAPELVGLLGYDEMQRCPVLMHRLKGSRMAAVPTVRSLMDCDVAEIQEFQQRQGIARIGKDTIHQACDLIARERSFHPVRDYLEGLQWDGKPRLDTWLSVYLGTEASAYTEAIGPMFLTAMVARVFEPGCQADYMMILEGDQGERKSSACKILAGGWYSDGLPPVNGPDHVRLSMHLRGKWLIEVGELSAMQKAEVGALKLFVTQCEEKYTPKYGRIEVKEPRQCLFIGTTNKKVYLRDDTGNRRFWPVFCASIDLTGLARDRDQLFAEAVVRYRSNYQYWPDRDFEKQFITPQQDQRFEADAWEGVIQNWVADLPADPNDATIIKTKVPEVAYGALEIDAAHLGPSEQRRITGILQRLGWTPGRNEYGRWWQILAAIRSTT